jgi:hypothetical protein
MASRLVPVAVFNVFSGTRWANQRPTITPKRLVASSAEAAPAKTIQGEFDSADIKRVASWVLSPSSARKIVTKAVKNSLARRRARGFNLRFWTEGLNGFEHSLLGLEQGG